MIRSSVKSVKVNPSKLRNLTTNSRLGSFMASEAMKGMDQFVPYRFGPLSGSVTTEPFHVIYGMSYAKYPYFGENFDFTRDVHPNATAKWDQAFVKVGIVPFCQTVELFIKGM